MATYCFNLAAILAVSVTLVIWREQGNTPNVPSLYFWSLPLMKTLDRSVEPCFARYSGFIEMNAKISRIAFTTERFDGLCIHAEFDWALHSFLYSQNSERNMTDILPGCRERTNWDNSDSNVSVFFIVFHRNLIQMILLIKVWFVIQYAFVHLFFNHN